VPSFFRFQRQFKTVTGMLTTAYLLAGALSLLPFDFSVVA
jgi:hypothetical protein